MDAHRMAGDLEAATYTIVGALSGALACGIAESRARAAKEQADDHAGANLISSAIAGAHANVAASLRKQLIGADGEIRRLQMRLDDAQGEVADLTAVAADLIRENAALRDRLH
jgi:hypothetical protein